MSSSQRRAIRNYRARLGERGLARFEVLGLAVDRDLIRALARRLGAFSRTMAGEPPKKGGILAALRRSPLVGADLDLRRSRAAERMAKL